MNLGPGKQTRILKDCFSFVWMMENYGAVPLYLYGFTNHILTKPILMGNPQDIQSKHDISTSARRHDVAPTSRRQFEVYFPLTMRAKR